MRIEIDGKWAIEPCYEAWSIDRWLPDAKAKRDTTNYKKGDIIPGHWTSYEVYPWSLESGLMRILEDDVRLSDKTVTDVRAVVSEINESRKAILAALDCHRSELAEK